MTKVIIFNGPPDSGKDIAAKESKSHLIAHNVHAEHHEFKGQLFKLTKVIYCISDELWDSWYTREGKEIPRPELNGLSCRGALIHTSEKVIKPIFGDEYFGEFAAKYDAPVVVFSDGGFVSELYPLIEKHGFDNIAVVRIYRDGCNFNIDSRDYLPDGIVGTMYDIQNKMPKTNNDAEYLDFLEKITLIVDNFLLGSNWGRGLLSRADIKINGKN
jgi:hypothetical protein